MASSLVVISLCVSLWAQESKKISIAAFVRDAFTRETIKDAIVTVYDADSTLLDTMFVRPVLRRQSIFRHHAFVPASDIYLLKAECLGYETQWGQLTLMEAIGQKVPELLLHKSSVVLNEVTVTGSKILMVNKGDTVVYNASALQLSSGSMLDKLILRLPGVELHRGGRITVNGEFISELLVNGRDFFKGDPKVALDNMPAYYVDKIKVFRQLPMAQRVMMRDSVGSNEHARAPLVMDVRLKRDYAEGWLGNAQAGYGLGLASHGGESGRKCSLARLFAMRHTKHSGLYVYANANNLNNDGTVADDGSWAERRSDEGIVNSKTCGINFSGSDKKTMAEYSTSAKLSFTNAEYERTVSCDNYFATGDVFHRARSQLEERQTRVSWQGSVTLPKPGRFLLSFRPLFLYNNTRHNGVSRSASFLQDPQDRYRGASIDSLYAPSGSLRLTTLLINQREMCDDSRSTQTSLQASSSNTVRIQNKWVLLSLEGNYENKSLKNSEQDLVQYAPSTNRPNSTLNRYTRTPDIGYDYKIQVASDLVDNRDGWRVRAGYSFRQQFYSGERQLYHIGNSGQYYSQAEYLPSATDSLQALIDLSNSYSTSTMSREHGISFNLQYNRWNIDLPVTLPLEHITDKRNGEHRTMKRNKPCFSPSLNYLKSGKGERMIAVYQLSMTLPRLSYLLDTRDDSDPLVVSLGNSRLKTIVSHLASFSYNKTQTKQQRHIDLKCNLSLMQQALSMGSTYDLTTGVTIIRPENINGNWFSTAHFTFGQTVDSKKHFTLSATAAASFRHCVDFARLSADASSLKSIVNNLRLGETLKADYRLHDWYVAATAHADWVHATSPAAHFVTVDACDFNYGLTLTKQLVKDLTLDSEMMMWSRRGYTDATMNDNELIWNAALSYAFGRRAQWVVKAEGRDILRRQSSVRQMMNAQGRTETWYKTIPSYWLLSLQYQFKKAPKKRGL